MSGLNWVRVAMEGLIQRNGSEYIRDESEQCFASRTVKRRVKSTTTTCSQCGDSIKRKGLKNHKAKVHGLNPKIRRENAFTRANFTATTTTERTKKRRRRTIAKYLRAIAEQDKTKLQGEVRVSDLARELRVLPAIIVRRARLKGVDVDLPYHKLSLEMAQEIRSELKRRVR